jgi:peroxiredoxin
VQLVELQDAWRTRLEQAGVAVFALSYDSVETLARFAEKYAISFPLLSDEGSATIRGLGLLNEHLVAQHAFYGIQMRQEQYGVAYPGTFVLDERGVVVQKHFEQSYRVRPTARIFEEFALGSAAAAMPAETVRASGSGVVVRAWTDAPTYRPYQQVRLHLEIDMDPGVHIYASPVPEGYTALELSIEPLQGLIVGQPALPPARPLTMEGLDEQFLAYHGSVRATVPLQFTQNLGEASVVLQMEYQACTDSLCYPPETLRIELPLIGLDVIRD